MELSAAPFTFLRPVWLLGLLALPLIWWLWRHRRAQRGAWQQAVDAHLLPHLLQQVQLRGGHRANLVWLLAGALAVVALAGPSWQQQAAPLWQKEAPLVIALDLSAAMRAADLPPSRLVQVRAKLGRLLQQRRSGQVGLLAYAGDAFTVAPITRDGRTVSALLDSLDPDVMPVEGQRSDRAIQHALKMLRDSEASSGEILLVTDHADTDGNFAATQARTAGIRVSVLGVGTVAGAPLVGKNGFITGPDGQPRLARLDPASLSALAAAGGGSYAPLTADDSDLAALGVLDPAGRAESAPSGAAIGTAGSRDNVGVTRSDDGYWLLLALLPLVLFGFRRGWLAVLPLMLGVGLLSSGEPGFAQVPGAVTASPAGSPPQAADALPDSRFSWDALWQRADQRAHAALQAGDTERARQLAPDPALKGAAAFRGDDYAAAAQAWAQDDAADAHYNRGNALAKSGKLEEALRAYDEALARQPDMADALANRKAVEDFLKQQQQQQSKDQQKGDQQKGDQQQGDQQKGDQQQGDQQKGDQQQGDQQQGDQQQGDQQQGDQQQGDQQQGDQQQGDQQQGDQQQGDQQQGDQQQGDQQQGDQQQGDQEKGDQQKGDQQKGDPKADDQAQRDAQDGNGAKEADEASASAKPATAAEQAQQREAEAAARQQMQQALDAAAQQEPQGSVEKRPLTAEERQQAEQQQATEQLLRRVPDDPGALLRRKFEMEYRRRLAEGEDR